VAPGAGKKGRNSLLRWQMFGVEEEALPDAPETGPERGRPFPFTPRIDEIVERIEHPVRRFPIERAILISLFVHLVLLIFLILQPPGGPRPADLARPREKPVQITFFVPPAGHPFFESPGPSRPNPRRNLPLSDKTRTAGGGDSRRARSDTPFVPPSNGIEGLAPGPRGRSGSQARDAEGRRQASAAAQAAPGSREDRKKPPGEGVQLPAPPAGQPGTAGAAPDLGEAIRKAAGAPFAGEGGAPRSNPEGGFVDSGPISFDTQWYDWGDYAAEMIRRIKLNWDVPDLARIGVKGKLTIRFFIRADGAVEGEEVVRGSSIPPYDHAAFQAIALSSPFRPLPAVLHEDREGVTVTFFYNIRLGEDRRR
jgi:hypothetical protein